MSGMPMLRFDHMQSDFNPMFLFLGDSNDLASLSGLLRAFAKAPGELDVGEQLKGSRSRATLKLIPIGGDDGDFGMKARSEREFHWGLNAWQAERIAERIDLLTPSDCKSGSDIIELGVEGEIPVKISHGEFTDDFLVKRF
jgi:hypothetical protein